MKTNGFEAVLWSESWTCHCQSKEGNRVLLPVWLRLYPSQDTVTLFGIQLCFAMCVHTHSHTYTSRAGIEIISSENSCDAFKRPAFDRLLPSYGLKSHQAPHSLSPVISKQRHPASPFCVTSHQLVLSRLLLSLQAQCHLPDFHQMRTWKKKEKREKNHSVFWLGL